MGWPQRDTDDHSDDDSLSWPKDMRDTLIDGLAIEWDALLARLPKVEP